MRAQLQRAAVGLPSRLPVIFFWAALVVCLTLLVGEFRPFVVIPLLGLVIALTWRMMPEPMPLDDAHRRGALWALSLAAAWTAINMIWAGEVLLVQRDPGFLTLEGVWLTTHADPAVPVGSAAEVAARVPDARLGSDAFSLVGDVLQAQGAKTFPGLLGMAGWVAGVRGVLLGNVLIGGIALLAVYDVARRLIGPRWGLIPMGALALSTPMLYFSRSAFTEPTNIALTFAGLAVLWSAYRDPRAWRFALGGAMIGATALSRIDGAAVSAGLILGLGVVAAASEPGRRRDRVVGLLAAGAASLAMVGLGYLDLALDSVAYLEEHRSLYLQLILLLVACLLLAAGLMVILRRDGLRSWIIARRGPLGTAAAVLVVVGALVLASRPLWMQAHGFTGRTNYMAFIASAQKAAGVAVDGTRSYDEATLAWLFWYLGPVTLVLAVIGAALLVRRCIVGWRPELVVLLATLGIPSLLYLVRPSITPDHIWAMRRMLPAVIPATLLFAGWMLPGIMRSATSPRRRFGAWALVVSVLVAPLVTWGTLVLNSEYGGRADQVDQVCEVVQGKRVVVVRGSGPPWLPTVRIMCDADVVEIGPQASAEDLAQIREVWGEDVLVLTDVGELLPWADAQPEPWLSRQMARWPHSLYPGWGPVRFRTDLWIATIEEDGSVTPVAG